MKSNKHRSPAPATQHPTHQSRRARDQVSPIRTAPQLMVPVKPWIQKFKAPAVVAAILLFIGSLAGIAYSRARGTVIQDTGKQTAKVELNVSRAVDSPIGFLPGFADVDKGKVKIIIDGISVAPRIEKEVAFYVQNNGVVAYDILPDDPSVTALLKYLSEKNGGTFDAAKNGASRFMKLDFLSLFNLNSLVSEYPDLYNGLLTAYNTNGSVQGAAGILKPARKVEACSANAVKLQGLIADTALNTQQIAMTNTVQSSDDAGKAKLTFSVVPGFFADIDTAVKDFITDCYITNDTAETDKALLEQAIRNYTTHPTYDFVVTVGNDGKKSLDISAAYANPDMQKNQGPVTFRFEMSTTAAPDVKVEGAIRSFFERPNLYGLSYSYCRVPPLVARSTADAKLLLTRPNSTEYKAPSTYDMVYACTSKDQRLTDYTVLPSDIWVVGGRTIKLKPEASALAMRQHDIAVAAELHFEKNGHYPSVEIIQAGSLSGLRSEDLQDTNGQVVNKGDISYGVLPDNCSECIEYSLGYKVDTAVELVIKDYAHQSSW